MADGGLGFKTIGDFAGRRSPASTEIYAIRDQHPDQAGSPASRRTAQYFAGIPD